MMIVLEGDEMMKLIGVFAQELSSLVEFSWVSRAPSSVSSAVVSAYIHPPPCAFFPRAQIVKDLFWWWWIWVCSPRLWAFLVFVELEWVI